MTATSLSRRGAEMLSKAETTIERGLSTFMQVGEALGMIRDGRLYRADHATFEDYCRDRWGMSRRRANQLVEAAEMGTMVPNLTNERQARALKEADDPTAVYAEAEARGDTSGAGIARVVAERKVEPEDRGAGASANDVEASGVQVGHVAGAGSGDDEQDDETPAPSPAPKVAPRPESIEERNAREAEERRLSRNVAFGQYLIGMRSLLGDGSKPIDDLLAGWVPEECPMWLVDAHKPVFTPDGIRAVAAVMEKLAAEWESRV